MPKLEFSNRYKELFKTKARYIHLWGGRGRGGSFTATQYFLSLCIRRDYFRGYLMREIAGDIRESLWRDLKDRIEEAGLEDDFDLNESSMIARHRPTGNTILSKGFKKSSGNRTAKLKSLAGATHVIIEESEEINQLDFIQLDDSLRTTKGQIQILQLFNPPPKNHWIWKQWYHLSDAHVEGYFKAIPKSNENLLSIFSTYRDNIENLNQSFLDNIKLYVDDHLQTMINGLISEGARGRIYRNWKLIEKMPNTYPKFYGLDWGFSGDPLALVECEAHNRKLYVDEKLYEYGMTNDQLHDKLIAIGIKKSSPIIADSAEPKDIEDMRRRGWNITGAKKGPGSVLSGIKFINQYEVHLTSSSKNVWHETENYAWALDQYKLPTNEPIDKFNHALDSLNYAMDKVRVPSGMGIIKPSANKVTNGRTIHSM
jgi:phage terminase large subunit